MMAIHILDIRKVVMPSQGPMLNQEALPNQEAMLNQEATPIQEVILNQGAIPNRAMRTSPCQGTQAIP